MMKAEILNRGRKILGSICVSVGVLSIANIDTIWQEYQHRELHESHALVRSNNRWVSKDKIKIDSEDPTVKPLQSALSRSLEQDELHEQNPFAQLSTLDPLQDLMRKGVVKFHRETFRSPAYQEESGYDMISYEIDHTDGSRSSVLAYLESPNEKGGQQIGQPDERIPFVVFMVPSGAGSSYSFYRGGTLVEQSALTVKEAQAFVAQRLSAGVPFLSVAR